MITQRYISIYISYRYLPADSVSSLTTDANRVVLLYRFLPYNHDDHGDFGDDGDNYNDDDESGAYDYDDR